MKKLYFTRSVIATAIACLSSTASMSASLPTEAKANAVALAQIGATAAWARGYTGTGVRIGFVDTGADLRNVDLSNVKFSYSPYSKTITDVTNGHGTAMISIGAGAKNGKGVMGVAYDSTVLAYAGGSGGMLSASAIGAGIKWNADMAATAINLSLGTTIAKTNFAKYYSTSVSGVYFRKNALLVDPYRDTSLLSSLQYATGKGSIAVMAAGNDGNPVPASPANLAVATNASNQLLLGGRAVIVGAVDDYNRIATFSNRAGHICQTMVKNVCSDTIKIKDYFLVAPGGSYVWNAAAGTTSNINASLGTSASTAFVTGGIALIKQAWPTLRPEQIVQVLLKTATDLGATGVDEVYGNGLMNLNAATKPLGTLTLAKITGMSTTAIAAGPVLVSKTSLTGGVLSKQSFDNSAVLSNAQAVDEMGRNFTVDARQGIQTSMQNFNSVTAYSVLSTSQINAVDFDRSNLITSVYTSNNLSGIKFGKTLDSSVYVGMELGTATENSAVLGSQGSGAFALGNSTTDWVALHTDLPLNANTKLTASMSHGYTAAGSAADSLITEFSTITTNSWSIGLQKNRVFTDTDSISAGFTELPHITSGTATLAGVTGFVTNNITDEGAESTPEVTRELVNLRSDYRQYVSHMTYSRNIGANQQLNFGITAQTDNAGTLPITNYTIRYLSRF